MTVAYDDIGRGYGEHRRADPRLAAAIRDALGDARSVINVGAGAGSYEPADLDVLAIEPSSVMLAQCGARQLRPDVVDRALARLRHDIRSGAWHERHDRLGRLSELDVGLRIVRGARWAQ